MGRSESPLTIAIPTYNHADFIEETLDHALDQTVEPFEILVSNNHSTDRTDAILERYAGRIRVVRPPEHLTMMANWNFMLGEVRSEWAVLMSSDDVPAPVFVEAIERGIAARKDAVVVRGNSEVIDDAAGETFERRKRDLSVKSPRENLIDRLAAPRTNLCSAAFRMDAWREVGGFNEDFRLAGDWAFWVELCPHGSFVTVPEFVCGYRRGHRTDKEERSRVMLWCRDLERLYHETLPRVAQQIGGVQPAQIRNAMRQRCHHYLMRLARGYQPDERDELATDLEEWADRCDVRASLEKFRAGEKLKKQRFRRLRRFAASLGIG